MGLYEHVAREGLTQSQRDESIVLREGHRAGRGGVAVGADLAIGRAAVADIAVGVVCSGDLGGGGDRAARLGPARHATERVIFGDRILPHDAADIGIFRDLAAIGESAITVAARDGGNR